MGSGDGQGALFDSSLSAAFMTNRARLKRFISIRCGTDSVDDLVQEVWLKAQAVETPVEKPLSYLFRIADRLIIDNRRGSLRGRTRDNDWAFTQDRTSESAEPALAERQLLAREQLEYISKALDAVGERAALVFRRCRLDGLKQQAVADELGIGVSTVEKDLRKIYDVLLAIQDTRREG